MSRKLLILFFLSLQNVLAGQPNCEVFVDSLCKKSCEIAWEAARLQGLKKSQELFDESIRLCPGFSYAYYEKSVPYLKQGLLKEWKKLMDKAVELDSAYLLQRGINQVQFMRNYEGGLQDLNAVYAYFGRFDIGYSPSGEYHGQLIRAICYQKLGEIGKAIEIMEQLISSPNYHRDAYDYFHIGIAYLEIGDFEKAKRSFDIQNEGYEYAETSFYYAKVYESEGNEKLKNTMLLKAKELYQKGQVMTSSYYHYIDKVFLSDIKSELRKIK